MSRSSRPGPDIEGGRIEGPAAEVGWKVATSLDGFIAGLEDNPGRIFDWYFKGDAPSKYSTPSVPFRLSSDDARIFDEGASAV
jgi:hypothetical protein